MRQGLIQSNNHVFFCAVGSVHKRATYLNLWCLNQCWTNTIFFNTIQDSHIPIEYGVLTTFLVFDTIWIYIPCKQLFCLCQVPIGSVRFRMALELSVKSLKEGRDSGYDPLMRKPYVRSSLACRTLEPILKVG